MPRLFVAVELPPEVQRKLASVRNEIGKDVERVKWVPAENIHLTLQFLGSCPEELVSQIEEELKKVAREVQSFNLRLSSLGGFPSLKRARVLWMGTEAGREQLMKLQEMVEESLSLLGLAGEKRKFHPHVTLARLRVPQDLTGTVSMVNNDRLNNLWVPVEKVTLFESKLKPSGALYIPLAWAQLS